MRPSHTETHVIKHESHIKVGLKKKNTYDYISFKIEPPIHGRDLSSKQ